MDATSTVAIARQNSIALNDLIGEQREAYPAFVRFMDGAKRMAVLSGLGGTGKTFSVARYCMAYGLQSLQVLACAPTNTATKNLGAAMDKASFSVAYKTVHRLLGLAPVEPTWDKEDQEELGFYKDQIAAWDKSGVFDPAVYNIAQAKLQAKLRMLDAFKKKELVFASNAGVEIDNLRLIIIDECSMINKEIYSYLVADIAPYCKVLFMGDPNQLYPVKEGLSPTFTNPAIAEFFDVRRATGSIVETCKEMVRGNNPRISYDLLQTLDFWDEYANEPWEVPSGTACAILRQDAKRLLHHWIKSGLPLDGAEFRVLSFRNENVNKYNNAGLLMGQYDRPPIGSNVIGHNAVRRFYVEPTTVTNTLLTNSETAEVLEHGEPYHLQIPGFETITVYPLLIDTPLAMPGLVLHDKAFLRKKPENAGKQSWIYWTNDPRYQEAVDFWNGLRSSLFCQGKPPGKENDRVAYLFDLLGIDSWTAFYATPGLKTYKPVGNLNLEWALWCASAKNKNKWMDKIYKLAKDGDRKWSFYGIRSLVNAIALWLERDAVDAVKPLFASTVHKAQGATIQRTIMDLPDIYDMGKYNKSNGVQLRQQGLYTAASRAGKVLYVLVN